jgi:hypothetical protein
MEKANVVRQKVWEIPEMFDYYYSAIIAQGRELMFQKLDSLFSVSHLMQRENIEDYVYSTFWKRNPGGRYLDRSVIRGIGFACTFNGDFCVF